MYWHRDHPLYGFYRPFFETRAGQVFILSAPKDHIRDGLAAIRIARHFPIPGYEGISIEPSRPTVQPAENVILVGRASLFIERDLEAVRGRRPLGVGYEKLGQRLENIAKACCYAFSGSLPRVLVNLLSGVSYAAEERNELGKEVDYGVIRRVFRGASENTILVEGIHGLGTLGAAKIATMPAYLEEVWGAVSQIDGYDPSLPLEILVRTTFDPSLSREVYSLDAIEARLLNIVYNRKWIFDTLERCWVDQEPYDINLEAWAEERDSPGLRGSSAFGGPCLELEADLRRLDGRTRQLCRRFLGRSVGSRPRPVANEKGAREVLLQRLTSASDLFRFRLHEEASWGGKRVRLLPTNPSEIRLLRKKFLVHLVLCHLLGRRFLCRDRDIRRYFPEICRRRHNAGQGLVAHFTSTINGRMREGFWPLFGDREKPKDYVRILHNRKEKSYRLLLQRLRLVVKLRI